MLKFSSRFVLAFVLGVTLASSAYAQQDKKTIYAVLIDNTGSMRSQFQDVLELGDAILERIPNPSEGAVYHFKAEQTKNPSAVVANGLGWTQEKLFLKQYLARLFIVPGQTALLDAIDSVAEQLNTRSTAPDASEKIVVLITDGEDRSSKTKEKQLLQNLRDSNIKVYSVGLVRELYSERGFTGKSSREKAVGLLEHLARESGGRTVFSKSQPTDILKLVDELFAK